jgi:transcriptional regulator with XRE-family HTH domain
MVGRKKLHWTTTSVKDYIYRIASDFVEQLDSKLEAKKLSRDALASKLNLSKGRVSQIFNNPGNFTLNMLVKCARALELKVAIVAYDDNDPENRHGPIDSEIFRICWENAGKPTDYFALESIKPRITASTAIHTYFFIDDWSLSSLSSFGYLARVAGTETIAKQPIVFPNVLTEETVKHG